MTGKRQVAQSVRLDGLIFNVLDDGVFQILTAKRNPEFIAFNVNQYLRTTGVDRQIEPVSHCLEMRGYGGL